MKLTPCLAVVCAMLTIGCAAQTPTYPAPVLPEHGTAVTLEVGVQAARGQATFFARVLDPYSAPVVGAVVDFDLLGNHATFSTNNDGRAFVTLTAPPGVMQANVRSGSLSWSSLVAIQ